MTRTILKPRAYQESAIGAVLDAWKRGVARPAVVLPTGAGKTVVFAHLCDRLKKQNPGGRILVLAHRNELLEQAQDKLRSVAPRLSTGIVKGTRNETLADIVIASVLSLASRTRRNQLLNISTVIVDECHHATMPTYLRVLEHYGCFEAAGTGANAVGFTATMSRGDGGPLGDVWEDVVYSMTLADMIPDYLVRPRGIRVKVDGFDLTKIKKSGGDYAMGSVGEAMTATLAPQAIARAWAEHASGRPTIAFGPTVEVAHAIADAISDVGGTAQTVWGDMPPAERSDALDRFTAGHVGVLSNCAVLTEGTDLPLASCAVIARPTLHEGLYQQMVGRVLRQYPGKDDALVLDASGASERHSLLGGIDLFTSEDMAEREGADPEEQLLFDDAPGEGQAAPRVGADGKLTSIEVDLFHGSTSMWVKTAAGVWFLSAGERLIAILPAPERGHWDVVVMHARRVGESSWIAREISSLGTAMAWAEGEVTPEEATLARRSAGWRRQRPTDAQRRAAGFLGVLVREDMSKGELSNLLSVASASRRIDPRIPAYARGRL
jgi:superfamily II DNA or RNA helicase